jgi:hypothetical protein
LNSPSTEPINPATYSSSADQDFAIPDSPFVRHSPRSLVATALRGCAIIAQL